MIYMKILAVSNVSGEVDRAVEALENADAKIVAKEIPGDLNALDKTVHDSVRSGMYDYVLALPSDHIGACIQLNKYKEIKAAPCISEEDIRLAALNGANVIVVRSGAQLDFIGRNLGIFERKKEEAQRAAAKKFL